MEIYWNYSFYINIIIDIIIIIIWEINVWYYKVNNKFRYNGYNSFTLLMWIGDEILKICNDSFFFHFSVW